MPYTRSMPVGNASSVFPCKHTLLAMHQACFTAHAHTPTLQAAQRAGWVAYSVWLTGASATRTVPLWVDLQPVAHSHGEIEGELEVSISTLSMPSTELHSISQRMPDWTSVVQYETFQTVVPLQPTSEYDARAAAAH